MKTLEAAFQIVTPMFIGGANQKADDGIRPPSVKGTLRFWWRALNWGRLRSQASCDEAALALLHAEENRLFGATASDNSGGQGCFLLTVQHNVLTQTASDEIHQGFARKDAARYLGYGLMVAFKLSKKQLEAGQLYRPCVNEMQPFTVKLTFRGSVEPSIRNALIGLGMLGGLGSRSRHGLGSIALLKIREGDEYTWVAPKTREEYEAELKELIQPCCKAANLPPYSAFSQHARIDNLLSANDPYDAMDMFGKAMLVYRSWGKGGQVLGSIPSEKRFEDDHDWFKKARTFRTKNPNFHPRRVVFGLPHNYWKPDHTHVTPGNHERRASPLLFHVHQIDKQFIGVSVLLRSQFLPAKEQINAGGKMVPAKINWSDITDFLDGKVGNPPPKNAANRFSSKTQVIP